LSGRILAKRLTVQQSNIEITMNDSEVNRERVIEDAIMRSPDELGYPGARCIRNWRVALTCGRVDVGLLPIKGPKKLVLIEAKSARAPDAQSKVVGQLLMYYAGALTLGSQGLACLRAFADKKCARCSQGLACRSPRADKQCARDTSKKALIRLAGLGPTETAWKKLSGGKLLLPRQLSLYIALDDKPHEFLREMLGALRRDHDLSIGLIIVRNRRVVDVIDG
jgi:hypothetical protein